MFAILPKRWGSAESSGRAATFAGLLCSSLNPQRSCDACALSNPHVNHFLKPSPSLCLISVACMTRLHLNAVDFSTHSQMTSALLGSWKSDREDVFFWFVLLAFLQLNELLIGQMTRFRAPTVTAEFTLLRLWVMEWHGCWGRLRPLIFAACGPHCLCNVNYSRNDRMQFYDVFNGPRLEMNHKWSRWKG